MNRAGIEGKRSHRRLNIRLPMSFHKENVGRSNSLRTVSINVSTGGIYFETAAEDLKIGDRLAFELAVPPEDGRFPPEGKITTKGKVVRTTVLKDLSNDEGLSFARYGVAAQFEESFKLTF